MKETTSKRQARRSEREWQALIGRVKPSGESNQNFWHHEGISQVSFYRWRCLAKMLGL